MSNEARTVYDMMLERFRETKTRHVVITVPMEFRNSRREIVIELESAGLISNADIRGQQYIACTLTDDNLCNISIQY